MKLTKWQIRQLRPMWKLVDEHDAARRQGSVHAQLYKDGQVKVAFVERETGIAINDALFIGKNRGQVHPLNRA